MKMPDVQDNTNPLPGAPEAKAASTSRLSRWVRRFGWAGMIFFTAKGIIWLLIFWGAAEWVF